MRIIPLGEGLIEPRRVEEAPIPPPMGPADGPIWTNEFQTLIGTVKTQEAQTQSGNNREFQTLIGTVKTVRLLLSAEEMREGFKPS